MLQYVFLVNKENITAGIHSCGFFYVKFDRMNKYKLLKIKRYEY